MILSEATQIAQQIVSTLAPHCERCEIAGSIRRRKPQVGDIEIVCIPKADREPDLFGSGAAHRSQHFIRAAYSIGKVVKGHPIDGKYIQFEHASGIQVDLFTAQRDNWGLIYAIRTGSAEFSHRVLACGWVRAGYRSEDGMLHRGETVVPVREEEQLFELINVAWVPPENRT